MVLLKTTIIMLKENSSAGCLLKTKLPMKACQRWQLKNDSVLFFGILLPFNFDICTAYHRVTFKDFSIEGVFFAVVLEQSQKLREKDTLY